MTPTLSHVNTPTERSVFLDSLETGRFPTPAKYSEHRCDKSEDYASSGTCHLASAGTELINESLINYSATFQEKMFNLICHGDDLIIDMKLSIDPGLG
jgi:hypothetical protein